VFSKENEVNQGYCYRLKLDLIMQTFLMNFVSGVADVECMSHETNITRLDTAFYVAEVKLGITRLIDPEDVDVENPDEKSIMTYVAQFLHRYPEGSEGKVR